MSKAVLLKFNHGLGDAVQFTCVLQHLRKHRPDWKIYVKALRGKHSALPIHCEKVWHDQEPDETATMRFAETFDLSWYENYNNYADCPNTKVTNCLKEVFKIEPEESLLRYSVEVGDEAFKRTQLYLSSITPTIGGRIGSNVVVIHYQGNTSAEKKNLQHDVVAVLCRKFIAMGLSPIILDWDKRSPLPNGKTIFNPGVGKDDLWGNTGTGDAATICALISQSALFVGIDSGPQKCAGATDTPSIAVWTQHDPLRYYDLCPNVVHLISEEIDLYPLLKQSQHWSYFDKHYRHRQYTPGELVSTIVSTAESLLPKREYSLVRVKVDNTKGPDVVGVVTEVLDPKPPPKQSDIILTVPQGIGDVFWIYKKFAPHVDRLHWRVGVVKPTTTQLRAAGKPEQGQSFLDLLPQTASVSFGMMKQDAYDRLFSSWSRLEDVLGQPMAEYACNKPLEEGVRIEEIDPGYDVMETVPIRCDEAPMAFEPGSYVAMYVCGSTFDTNYRERFSLWSIDDWVRFMEFLYRRYRFSKDDRPVMLMGASYDRDVLEALQEELKGKDFRVWTYIDSYPANVTYMISRSVAFIGYQSGLGVMADNMDVPSLFMTFPCYPKMLHSWAKKKNIAAGVFNAALFSSKPEEVIETLQMPL